MKLGRVTIPFSTEKCQVQLYTVLLFLNLCKVRQVCIKITYLPNDEEKGNTLRKVSLSQMWPS